MISPLSLPPKNYAKYNTALFSSMNDYILQILAGTKTLDDLPTFQADWKMPAAMQFRLSCRPGTTVLWLTIFQPHQKGPQAPFLWKVADKNGGIAMDKRPNILWLCTDQQRWDTIHAFGQFIH